MYRDRAGHLIKVGATVQTPTGILGKVKSFSGDGRANIIYEWRPKWQPPRGDGLSDSPQSSGGAKEVSLRPALLRVV